MERIAVIGDIHISKYSSILRSRGEKYSTRLEKIIEALNWLEKTTVSLGCTKEIFLGDEYDKPDLQCEEISASREVNWNHIKKYMLVGNHDSNLASLDFSSADLFGSNDIVVVNNTRTLEINDKVNITLIPYITCNKELSLADYIEDPTKKNIVCAHQDIAGLQYGKFLSKTGFSLEDIKNNCTLMLDGHLHNGMQVSQNCYLVGNFTGQNFNEDAMKYNHNIYILDIEDDGTIKISNVIENPFAINFYHLALADETDLQQLEFIKDNAVISLSCPSSLSAKAIEALKNNNKVLEYRVNISYDYVDEGEAETFTISDGDVISKFIEFAKEKLEPSEALSYELAKLGGATDENSIQ